MEETIEILKRKEVSAMFKIPIRTLDYLVATGQIPFSRIGKRSVRFSKERLKRWFHEREGVEFRQKRNRNRNG